MAAGDVTGEVPWEKRALFAADAEPSMEKGLWERGDGLRATDGAGAWGTGR